jgi:hypothetical protein
MVDLTTVGIMAALVAVLGVPLGWLLDRLRTDVAGLTALPQRVAYVEGRVDAILGVTPHRGDFMEHVEELGARREDQK